MPHFEFLTNKDGSIAQIQRDGTLHHEKVTLEPVHQIVSTYFKIAAENLAQMKDGGAEQRRHFGLQAFLMSLTGVEAFNNVYFQLLAMQCGKPELMAAVSKQSGSLVRRLEECLRLSFAEQLPDQDVLIERIRRLYRLRSDIVHPRWEPTSMRLSGEAPILIFGLAQNFQAAFENEEFCREAFWWSVKLVAEVGRAAGNTVIEGHCFYWTGVYGLTDEELSRHLSVAATEELKG